MTDDQPELYERVTAGRLLSLTAARTSEHMGSFGNWLLIGVGAAYSLIVVNLASVQQFLSLWSIQTGLLLLLVVIVLGVLQRFLASVIAASSAAGEKAEKIGHDLADRNIKIDFKIVFREMEKGTYYPAKWIIKRSFEKVLAGDFAASGRMSAGLAQIQSWLVFAQAGFSVAAITTTAYEFKV